MALSRYNRLETRTRLFKCCHIAIVFCHRDDCLRISARGRHDIHQQPPHSPAAIHIADQWALSVPFPLRFLFASRAAIMGKVLGIVYRTLATHLINKAGFTRKRAHAGAVTLIQRFGSALNLNIHFHMLFLDDVYVHGANG